MTRVQARTIALRHQLLAALRNADEPVPTNALCRHVASGGANCGHSTGAARQIERCHGGCWWTRVYPQLRALQRMGLVEWYPYPNRESILKAVADGNLREHPNPESILKAVAESRCAYWQYITDAEVAKRSGWMAKRLHRPHPHPHPPAH